MSIPTKPNHAPRKPRRWIAPTAIGAAALITGIAIGAAGETTTTSSEPTPVETITAEPIVETITEEVEITPQACLDYINYSEQVYGLSSDMVGHSMAMVDAVDTMDVAAAEGAVAGMEEVNTGLEAISDDLLVAKAACANGAGDGA